MEKKKAQAKRKHARLKLSKILSRQGGRCFHCGRHIVQIKSIPMHLREKVVGPRVYFRDENGDYLFAFYATVDHLKPLREDGTNVLSNLVASCARCNCGRG